MEVQFYMKRLGVDEDYIDIEERFKGMRYMKCDGLEDLGKPKNIYTETYADADSLRVYLPSEVKRAATTITFTFLFLGYDKQDVYDEFNEFIKNQKIYYYDTARKKRVCMIFQNATKPKEDNYVGSLPYIISDYTFQNIKGEATPCDLAVTATRPISTVGMRNPLKVTLNGKELTPAEVTLKVIGGEYNIPDGSFDFYGQEKGEYTIYAETDLDNDIIKSNSIILKYI
jgi:hypothetical protein